MARKIVSAEEIRQYVQDLVNKDESVIEDGLPGEVGTPIWNETDADGCNWHLKFSRNMTGHVDTLRDAVEIARQKFNLQR